MKSLHSNCSMAECRHTKITFICGSNYKYFNVVNFRIADQPFSRIKYIDWDGNDSAALQNQILNYILIKNQFSCIHDKS